MQRAESCHMNDVGTGVGVGVYHWLPSRPKRFCYEARPSYGCQVGGQISLMPVACLACSRVGWLALCMGPTLILLSRLLFPLPTLDGPVWEVLLSHKGMPILWWSCPTWLLCLPAKLLTGMVALGKSSPALLPPQDYLRRRAALA